MIVRQIFLLGTLTLMLASLAIARSASADQTPEPVAAAVADVPASSTAANSEVQSERWKDVFLHKDKH